MSEPDTATRWRLFAQHALGEHRFFWIDGCSLCYRDEHGVDAWLEWTFS